MQWQNRDFTILSAFHNTKNAHKSVRSLTVAALFSLDTLLIIAFVCVIQLLDTGCSRKPVEDAAVKDRAEHGVDAASATNRIDVPESVRRNLGITFAKVELRPVAQTIRVPGQFELRPEARREYRTMLSGRVELLVKQYDRVETGAPLYRLASPEWRDLQGKLSEAESTIRQTEARVGSIPTLISAHHRHEQILEKNIVLWEQQVAQLEESHRIGAISAGEYTAAQNTLSSQRAELAEILEKEADLQGQIVAAQAEHDAAHARFRLLIATSSTLLGLEEKALAAPYSLDEHLHTDLHPHEEESNARPSAAWRNINELEVKASVSGIIDTLGLTNGAWASTGSLVLSVADPAQLRFRALAMQGDLGRLRDGLPARIVPPKGGSIKLQEEMDTALTIGFAANAQDRTIELVAVPRSLREWARPGVSGHLEVVVAGGEPQLAIPNSSVIQDGLSRIFFRRDPKNPDQVIRIEADLGVNDGRWVEVQSGLREGDEVVVDGVYQLMIATSGSVQKGGHFHPDGTFHEGEDE